MFLPWCDYFSNSISRHIMCRSEHRSSSSNLLKGRPTFISLTTCLGSCGVYQFSLHPPPSTCMLHKDCPCIYFSRDMLNRLMFLPWCGIPKEKFDLHMCRPEHSHYPRWLKECRALFLCLPAKSNSHSYDVLPMSSIWPDSSFILEF